MWIDIATLFPEMCRSVLSQSIIGRGVKNGHLDIGYYQIRDYTRDRHRNVDDTPYGPGRGMLLMADPIFRTYEACVADRQGSRPWVIYLSPQGRSLTQQRALELSRLPHLFLLCGHYEGVDQRVLDEIVSEEISIGDYVLTGGELPAMVLVETVGRLCPGVLYDESCYMDESHFGGLLEHPQYTKPPVWHGRAVPSVLQGGNHREIMRYRREESLRITWEKRPELLERGNLSEKDKWYLRTLGWQGE